MVRIFRRFVMTYRNETPAGATAVSCPFVPLSISAFIDTNHVGTILADIAANLPQDYLSGAVNIGGKPYVGSDPSNVLKPAMLAVLHKLGPSVPAEEFEAALAQFPGLLFSDVDKVPWDVKWRWRGMMSNASPSSYMLTVTREVDSGPTLGAREEGVSAPCDRRRGPTTDGQRRGSAGGGFEEFHELDFARCREGEPRSVL